MLTMMVAVTALAATLAPADAPEVWAGHQVSFGTRKLPLSGTVKTRSDVWTLATVSRGPGGIRLEQRACMVTFSAVGGVSVRMDATALPRSVMKFEPREGTFRGRSAVSWGTEDDDDDGNPGMTVSVDSVPCSGDVYVTSASATTAVAAFANPAEFRGQATVAIRQTVLGASSRCLKLGAGETTQTVGGPFAFVPVDPHATCTQLMQKGWPTNAES